MDNLFVQLMKQHWNEKGFMYGDSKANIDKLAMRCIKAGIQFSIIKSEHFSDLWYITDQTRTTYETFEIIREMRVYNETNSI